MQGLVHLAALDKVRESLCILPGAAAEEAFADRWCMVGVAWRIVEVVFTLVVAFSDVGRYSRGFSAAMARPSFYSRTITHSTSEVEVNHEGFFASAGVLCALSNWRCIMSACLSVGFVVLLPLWVAFVV